MTDVKVPDGVGWTAFTTARGRAQESLRADRLFDDPLAGVFLQEAIAAPGRKTGRRRERGPRLLSR
jgi:O-methyltransferase involved in polyketide biosynthesis